MSHYQSNLSWQTINQEKIIYEHLRKYLITYSPEETIIEFKSLFLAGRSQNALIRDTIESIITSGIKQEKYAYILNYCFYIVINEWFDCQENQKYLLKLLKIFKDTNYNIQCYNRRKQKILALTQAFIHSKYYARLQRIALVLDCESTIKIDKTIAIKSLISRYTYLYKTILLGKENINEITQFIQELQINRTKAFEFKLAQHIIYRSRLIEIARAKQLSSGAGKLIRRVPNPTLLSDKDLRVALKQYIKKLDDRMTLFQLARKFVIDNSQGITYREFKRNLYDYLIVNIEPRNDGNGFQAELLKLIDCAYYQSDKLLINDSLILRTCRKLYQSLLINNSDKNQHRLLIKLIHNLGTAKTVFLLIKIVLICPQAKPDLEHRLGILFTYYETKNLDEVPWLAKLLEHFLVAFSIYFGKIDISLTKTM